MDGKRARWWVGLCEEAEEEIKRRKILGVGGGINAGSSLIVVERESSW